MSRIGDGGGRHVSRKRTDVDPGAAHVGGNNLIRERGAYRIEIHMPPYRIDMRISIARSNPRRSKSGQAA